MVRGRERHPRHSVSHFSRIAAKCAPLAFVIALHVAGPLPALAQESDRVSQLEERKLELEVAALERDQQEWRLWVAFVLSSIAAVIGWFVAYWQANRVKHAALDQAVHARRLEAYVRLASVTAPLALFFPSSWGAAGIVPSGCATLGSRLSDWYFKDGGLLLSEDSRNAYSHLARALAAAVTRVEALRARAGRRALGR